jgi:hypothetical protein
MNIRAKFSCNAVTKNADGSERVELVAVYGDENKPWSKFTPSGNLAMTISNPDAQGAFVPGKTYYLDLSPAEVP